MDLADHFRVIWHWRRSVALASVVIAVVVFGWSSTRAEVYRAQAVISVTSGRAVSGESISEQDTVFLTRNYAELGRTQPVRDDAARRSGRSLEAEDVADLATVSAAADVGFLTVSADGPSPSAAEALAAAMADALIDAAGAQQRDALGRSLEPVEEELAQLEAQLAQLPAGGERLVLESRYSALLQAATERRLAPTDRLALVAPAVAEPGAISPTPVRSAALAFLVALVVNAELAALIHYLRDTFSSEEQDVGADTVVGAPVLGRVPVGAGEDAREAFNTLRTNLMFMEADAGMRTVAVVSADPGTGKTYGCVNLAASVASLEVPVVVIDADLRRPRVHAQFGMSRHPGLSDLLAGASLEQTLRRVPGEEHLRLLAGGDTIDDPAGALASPRFSKVLDQLDWAAMVLVDTPASSLFADALAIASRCDATLLVVDARSTRRATVRRAVRQFEQVGANVIGLVLNRVESVNRTGYRSGRPEAAKDA